MSPPRGDVPSAVIFGCAGGELTPEEAAFFGAADPLGFILFARNCETPQQVTRLVTQLRDAVGRDDAPVFIDQEGGSVRRLRPPHWDDVPAAAQIGGAYQSERKRGRVAAELAGRLIAAQLAPLGITVTCAPVLDIAFPETTDAIGDRAFSSDPAAVATLARAFCEGLRGGGVLPVLKHMPGHGRATVDSHHEVPRVTATADELRTSDFVPFRELASLPLGMTAHVVFDALDRDNVATMSKTVIDDIIRGEIGFGGFLLSDDIEMGALSGDMAARGQAALAAGCDAVLHCSGEMTSMQALGDGVPPLSASAWERWQVAASRLSPPADNPDPSELAQRLTALIDGTSA